MCNLKVTYYAKRSPYIALIIHSNILDHDLEKKISIPDSIVKYDLTISKGGKICIINEKQWKNVIEKFVSQEARNFISKKY